VDRRRKFTDRFCRTFWPADETGIVEYTDTEVRSLILRINTETRHRTFAVKARVRGRLSHPIRYTIGNANLMDLKEARSEARTVLNEMWNGRDPRAARREARAAARAEQTMVFSAVAERYLGSIKGRRSYTQTRLLIGRLVREWGDRKAVVISQDDVSHLIASYASAGKHSQARSLLREAKVLWRFACGPQVPAAERLPRNPTSNLSAKDFNLRRSQRDRVLTREELRAAWKTAETFSDPWESYSHLLMLTGLRRGECAHLQWAWVNWTDKVITIPGTRMKAKRPYELPLTTRMLKILQPMFERRHPDNNSIFGRLGKTGLGPTSLDEHGRRWREKMPEGMRDWTLHDIRRSFRSGLSDIGGVPLDIREKLLAHSLGQIEATYDLSDHRQEKRRALERWGDHLMQIVAGETNVTPLAKAAS